MNSKELAELIHQNTRIILPEFGAFLVKDNSEKGFNPTNVSFSPFLRYNDGMLEVYVAKSRGISKEEAAKDVHEFVETIKNELLEKGHFEVEGLGFLNRDQRGKLSFTLSQAGKKDQPEKISTDRPTPQKEVIDESPQASETKDDKKDFWIEPDKPILDDESKETKIRKISSSKAQVEKMTVTKKVIKKTKKEEEPQQEPIKETTPETIIESVPDIKPEPAPTSQKVVDSTSEEPIIIEPEEKVIQIEEVKNLDEKFEKTPTPEIEIKKKKGGRSLLYTGIALVVVIVLFFLIRNYYFPPTVEMTDDSLTSIKKPESINKDKVEAKDKIEKPKDDIDKAYNQVTNENKKTKEQIKKEEAQEESIKNTLMKNTQIKKNSQVKNTDNKSNLGVKYYIIAGSFKKPSFAEKFLNEMKKSGYDASILIQPSGMRTVAIGSYSTREEANEAMKGFKNKLPNLWILKK